MLSEWLLLPGPKPFRKTVKFSLFICFLSHQKIIITESFWELSWSISRLHLNSRADLCHMIWPKVMSCKASRPMDLLEYSMSISPDKHSGFFLVGERENNVCSSLTAICVGKHLNGELRNYSRFLVIHPISIFFGWNEENTNLSVFKHKCILLHEHNSNEYCKEFTCCEVGICDLVLSAISNFESVNVKYKAFFHLPVSKGKTYNPVLAFRPFI